MNILFNEYPLDIYLYFQVFFLISDDITYGWVVPKIHEFAWYSLNW